MDKTWGGHVGPPLPTCCGFYSPGWNPDAVVTYIDGVYYSDTIAYDTCDDHESDISGDIYAWGSDDTTVAAVTREKIQGVGLGFTNGWGLGKLYEGSGTDCAWVQINLPVPVTVANLTCTPSLTRGGTATCTVAPAEATVTAWQFKDGSNNTVNRTQGVGSLTWSGVMATSGTVSATVSGISAPLTAGITVNNRGNFAFTAVNPTQTAGNSITCYNGDNTDLVSPPNATSFKGASCADLAFSFGDAQVSDNGPNNGYWYVTSVSDVNGSQPTQFPYIVVTDLLSATTFYNAQCGNYSSSNQSGFIAGSQLKQNVLDHEQGSVMSHWTEYRAAQNNPSNNVGTVLEVLTDPPGTARTTYEDDVKSKGQAAQNSILAAVAVEPCNGLPSDDSSQSCAYCGSINYSPYQQCGGNPVPYCH